MVVTALMQVHVTARAMFLTEQVYVVVALSLMNVMFVIVTVVMIALRIVPVLGVELRLAQVFLNVQILLR